MNDFCCYTVANNERKTFLPSVNTKLTLDLTKKDKEIGGSGEEMSFVIHLDTTPIRLGIDSTQVRPTVAFEQFPISCNQY